MIFNRLQTTKQVFESIRSAKPCQLFIASDGPRSSVKDEFLTVQKVRSYIINNIDWDCEVKTLFRENNLGCKLAVSGAINWFFEHVEMGIILEDDCLPKQEFFKFCDEGLHKFKNNLNIGGIGGFVAIQNKTPFLNIHGSVWGWATWRRAWENYDPEELLNKNATNFLAKNSSALLAFEKIKIAESLKKTTVDTWDYYWVFSRLRNNQFMLLPGSPLTKNIGFNENAGAHLSGDKPKAMENADNFTLKTDYIRYDKINFSISNIILTDYKRIFKRQRIHSLKPALYVLLRNPLLFFKIISKNLLCLFFVTRRINSDN